MKCPVCGSVRFYLKDPYDEYETHPFECRQEQFFFDDEIPDGVTFDDQTTSFCDQCAWHGPVGDIR